MALHRRLTQLEQRHCRHGKSQGQTIERFVDCEGRQLVQVYWNGIACGAPHLAILWDAWDDDSLETMGEEN